MRPAHPFSLTTVVFVMVSASTLATAQATKPAAPPNVFDPAAKTLALHHLPLPTSGLIVAQPGDWKAANAAVAEFPRGHGDVLKWEKAQANAAGQPNQTAAHGHHQHGGLR